jgi:hypothetical protein
MAGEVLNKMMLEAQKNGLLTGLAPDLVENGVGILQYADDTIICISHEPDKAVNLKLLLLLFELMSGLKINFSMSEIFVLHKKTKHDGQLYRQQPYRLASLFSQNKNKNAFAIH